MRSLLLTKYNSTIPGLTDLPGLDAGWLERRFRLFCDWPLLAVRAQVRRPDRWLIFVDAATPVAHVQALARAAEGSGELVPVAGPLTDEAVRELVAARLGSGGRGLLSTRLDSDDALAADYLARVLDAAETWRGFINAPLGYRLCEGHVLQCRERAGPFLSFAEGLDGSTPRTVFQVPHDQAERHGPVLQLRGRPAWLQVLHGGNLANRFAGWPVDVEVVCDDLGLEGLRERVRSPRLGMGRLAKAAGGQLRSELAWWVRRAPRLLRGHR